MGNFTWIGVIIGLVLLLGVNFSSLSCQYQLNGVDSKNSWNLSDNLSLANQERAELLPDDRTLTDYPVDDPSILLTNEFSDHEVNTDDDVYFEKLEIYVYIDVIETGTYTINVEFELIKEKYPQFSYDYNSSVYEKSITQYLEEDVHTYVIVPIEATLLFSDHFDTFRVILRSIRIYDSANTLCTSAENAYTSYEYNTYLFFLGDPVTRSSTLTTSSQNSDNSPPWNVPVGIGVLVAISILLYLLLRYRQL
jgi:hypothetical protein